MSHDIPGIPKPFHEWKDEQVKEDQRKGTPRTKEQYQSDYGRYCNKIRSQKS